MTQVVAGIIEKNGRVLLCRRTAAQPHPGKWEFPGGKVEAGEDLRAALARELEEELGIRASIGREIARYPYAYPGKQPILLIFFQVAEIEGEPCNRVFDRIVWEDPGNTAGYDFLEGDVAFLTKWQGYTESMTTMVEPAANEFLAQLESKSKKPSYFFRAMANRPEVLKTFVPLYGAVVGPGSVDRRIKVLVYLTCSYANKCAYCTAAQVATGAKAGVSQDEMHAIEAQQDGIFSGAELAAIRYARELTQTADAARSRAELGKHFNNEQIVEITLVAAMANFTNRFNNGLEIKPEASA